MWFGMTRINIHWFSCRWKVRLSCFEILCSSHPCNILPLLCTRVVFDSNSLSLKNLRIYNIMAGTRKQFSAVWHHIIWYIGTNVWEKLVAFYFQTFLPWSWRQQVGPGCWYQSVKPSVVTSWKTVCNINCCENHRVYTVIVLLFLLCTICKVKLTHKCPSNILFHYFALTFVLQRILDFNTCCGCFLDVEAFTVGYVMRKLAN